MCRRCLVADERIQRVLGWRWCHSSLTLFWHSAENPFYTEGILFSVENETDKTTWYQRWVELRQSEACSGNAAFTRDLFSVWRNGGLTPKSFQITELQTQATLQRNLISASTTHDLFLMVITQSLCPQMRIRTKTKALFSLFIPP